MHSWLAIALMPAVEAHGQCQLASFSAPRPLGGEALGWSVAANADFAVLGAYYGTGNFFGTGSAFVLKRVGLSWQHTNTLFANDGVFGDYFGSAAALDGDHLLIGSFRHPHASGDGEVYAYWFDGTNWTFAAKLEPPPGVEVSQFGYAIAAQNNRAIISAFRNDHGIIAGGAFMYRYVGTEWTFEEQLLPIDAPEALIGWSVAIDGDLAIAGSLSTSLDEIEHGAVYVFDSSGSGNWMHVATLTAPGEEAGIGFGGAVALQNGWAAVGSYKDSKPAHESGSVYMYVNIPGQGWSMHSRLVASDGSSHDYFGNALAMSGDTLLIGAVGRQNSSGKSAGGAYLFQRNGDTWNQTAMFASSALAAGDNFGWAVALSGDACLIGAPGCDIPLGDTGAVYAYMHQSCDCNVNGTPDACEIVAGDVADSNADGTPDGCQIIGCPADCAIPSDGIVNLQDIMAVINNWGSTFPLCELARVGTDQTIDGDDLLIVVENWGFCP